MDEWSESYVDRMVKYHREVIKTDRKNTRDNIINKRRGILREVSNCSEQFLHPEQVITIANRIKHKGKVCEEDLKILNCAFIEGVNNINAFLNVPGILHALVRELTGVSCLTQLAAAECLVNLSLGNSKCCFKIAKASGPYLITHLQGGAMNPNLQNTALWALGNLLGSDLKTWSLLNSQGVLLNLVNLLSFPEFQENVIYTLIHYVKTGFSEIPSADFNLIAASILRLKMCSSEVMCLLYLLSCSNYCDNVTSEVIFVCLDILMKCNDYDIKNVTASVRILANLVSEPSGHNANLILSDFDKIDLICKRIINCYPHLSKELVWLIGNLMYHPSSKVQHRVSSFIEKINLLRNDLTMSSISAT